VNGDTFQYVAGRTGAPQYQCKHEGFRFPTGTSTTVEFSLKITAVTADATGNVLTDDPDATTPRDPDTKPENDKAAVVINPTSAVAAVAAAVTASRSRARTPWRSPASGSGSWSPAVACTCVPAPPTGEAE
jgi:hypothetical protein